MSNYQITEADNLGAGGAKTKAKANLAAVRLLHQLEDESRTATPDEQAVLVKFSGWGTVPDIFTAKPDWVDLQSQLREVLTDGEFAAARAATLNAHYTAPGVVSAIYDGLERLGFSGGTVLDPSMGATGMFEGLMPESMRDRSEITGIELDSISGRIAQQLYPDATIHVRGLERTILPNDHFDLAISNVPFSEVKVSDPEYNGQPINTLHDYFFVKSLDKVRPGGLVAFITSTGTMQSGQSEGVREYLSERANLVGAIRLPNDTFRQIAGTDVTTDLILLQKLGDGVEPNGINWTKVVPSSIVGEDGTPLPINEYYQQRPEMLLGTLTDDTLYPGRLALQGDGRDLGKSIQAAFEQMPQGIYRAAPEAVQQLTAILVPPDLQDSVQPGSFVMHDDHLMRRIGNVLKPLDLTGKKLERVQGLIAVREAVQEVLNVQVSNSEDEVLEQAQANLTTIYDQFVEEF
ncbi:MAG TPA: N-6 DNA methylase, partial [Thermosynechococcaceae cyanobacterium]